MAFKFIQLIRNAPPLPEAFRLPEGAILIKFSTNVHTSFDIFYLFKKKAPQSFFLVKCFLSLISLAATQKSAKSSALIATILHKPLLD